MAVPLRRRIATKRSAPLPPAADFLTGNRQRPAAPRLPLLQFGRDHFFLQSAFEPCRLVAIMSSLTIGWIKIVGGRVVDGCLGLVEDDFEEPDRWLLDDRDPGRWENRVRDPWQRISYLRLKDLETHEGVTFVTQNHAGREALRDLSGVYVEHGFSKQLPVVEPSVDRGAPAFTVIGWREDKYYL